VNADFLALAARALRPGGRLHIATDWADYAQAIGELLAGNTDFIAQEQTAARPPTKYERRGERLGHAIVDFCLLRR
jgi:tRNA (guanine-N7-)-methyltransferase